MKQLFLHIGFNKTGSTSIQTDLVRNAAVLERAGYLYPGRPSDSYMQDTQHSPLAAALPERRLNWLRPPKKARLGQALSDLLEAISRSPAPNVILSSEAFGGLDMTREHVQRIRGKLADFDITAVAYIRRQDTYFLSTYQESIKNGATHPFEFSNFRKNRQLGFSRRLEPWRHVLGNDRVIVRPFDKAFWPQQELFFDFLTAIGAPLSGITPLKNPANESFDYRSVEVMRLLNISLKELLPGLTAPKQTAVRRNVLRSLRALEAELPDRGKMQLSSEQAEQLRQFFREDNQASLAGTGVEADAFFPASTSSTPPRLAKDTPDQKLLLKIIATLAVNANPTA
ncbi:hypothetical protein ACFMBG_21080 [Leisingera sp. D0M16]|uniref:hypothetical protein n=1 Tax=Leisingera coralii TaxID=3351347 RepID=UPI003B786AB0